MRCPGNYDDAVREAASQAARHGWLVVSDTSYPGYLDVPRDVMQGYTVMVEEVLAAWPGRRPPMCSPRPASAASRRRLCGHFWERLGPARPVFVTVEPMTAGCLFDSVTAGELASCGGDLDTIMAGLACGEPSLLAWRILAPARPCAENHRAGGGGGDAGLAAAGIEAGESGAAGLAGLMTAERAALGLTAASRVLVVGTRGGDRSGVLSSDRAGRPAPAMRPAVPLFDRA